MKTNNVNKMLSSIGRVLAFVYEAANEGRLPAKNHNMGFMASAECRARRISSTAENACF